MQQSSWRKKPRIPIWVAGTWSSKRAAFRRTAKYDGVFPMAARMDYMTPEEVREMVAYIKPYRADDAPFEVAIWQRTSGEDPAQDTARVKLYNDAGTTWWQEDCSLWCFSLADARARIRQGPPKI